MWERESKNDDLFFNSTVGWNEKERNGERKINVHLFGA
jgi:hypothetical protein